MDKEQAHKEAVSTFRGILERTKGYIAKLEVRFEDCLANNQFEKSAQTKEILNKFVQFQQLIENVIGDLSAENIERCMKELVWFRAVVVEADANL